MLYPFFGEIVVSMLMREGDGENHVKDAACPWKDMQAFSSNKHLEEINVFFKHVVLERSPVFD